MFGYSGIIDNISRLSGLESRSVCTENPTGGKGKGDMATEGAGAARGGFLQRRRG